MEDFSLQAERLERAALSDLHAAAPEDLRHRLGLELKTIGTALASVSAKDPSIVVNRAIGLGIEATDGAATIAQVRDVYESAGVRRFFFHLHPEARPEGLDDVMGRSGLVQARGWIKFRRGTDPAPKVITGFTVKQIGPEHAEDFGQIAGTGFGLSEEGCAWLAGLVHRPKWRLYMTFDGDTPAGTGALFIDQGMAWFDWGATAPAYRQRGSQAALLSRRIEDALKANCRTMVTATGEEVEGDPQHSFKNIVKAGFQPAYLRRNFAPPPQS
ncbi:hypothetical protein HBA54_07180 [Pelagibius litoralis]|uniref:N-acetyltransferase domain-containing protein n=1 Tax=Pelagibius litoralis TaxID=374515 RepID=A0A967C1Z9_9PROT|nr:hypothetical protein [Pelagibius litoralis]NIA68371.1 hypothetical protein [Pelagibius litoralis]